MVVGQLYFRTTLSPFLHHHHHQQQLDVISHVDAGFKEWCFIHGHQNYANAQVSQQTTVEKKVSFFSAKGLNLSIEVPCLPLMQTAQLDSTMLDEIASCLLEAPHLSNKLRIDPTCAEVSARVRKRMLASSSFSITGSLSPHSFFRFRFFGPRTVCLLLMNL
jgi:hypothetical protein